MRQQGQALLEFAVILPVFLILLLGGIDLTAAFGSMNALNHLAEDGARCAALSSCNATLPSYVASEASVLGLPPVTMIRETITNGGYAFVQITVFYPHHATTGFLAVLNRTFRSTSQQLLP